ncbi:MAG: hypothetical protein GYA24_03485 [Candidatus Lokiarchaeota archaeon]|nr:hypothetical protein [Candidatus Lokiarchaeota archaeon]
MERYIRVTTSGNVYSFSGLEAWFDSCGQKLHVGLSSLQQASFCFSTRYIDEIEIDGTIISCLDVKNGSMVSG